MFGSPHAASQMDSPVRVGEVVGGRYQVTRIIGRGGMGVVVEARRPDLNHRVALKVMHLKHLENHEAVVRFTKEGHAAAAVRGEHTVRLLDAGEHQGAPFLVMELLEGRDLDVVLADGPLPLDVAADYILQACEGMAEVHAHGMVHRDLKPSNLFLTQRADQSALVKILDFGIAKGVAASDPSLLVQTQTLIAMGTPLYMSPEQIRSSREVDARADVWSLGAIFYELVAGRPAFGGNTVTHITAQVLEAEPRPLTSLFPGLPPAVDAVVTGALAKNADARFVDVAALATALEPFAGGRSAGTAARCARILAGSMRADLATSPPVARDGSAEDGAHGTMRFDRGRRRRIMRVAIAVLGVLALLLTALVVVVLARDPRAQGMTLAKRGLRARFDAMTDATSAPISLGDLSAKPANTEPAVSSTASARPEAQPSTPPSPTPSGAVVVASRKDLPTSTHTTPTTTAPATTPPTATTGATTAATTQPTATKPFDPFHDHQLTMAKKLFLTFHEQVRRLLAKPTVTAMRERLGGRVNPASHAPLAPGSLVELRAMSGEHSRVAVVLSSSDDAVHVYLEQNLARRTSLADVAPFSGDAPTELESVALSLRTFATLTEGSSVIVERSGAHVLGVLREKCRHGALVELADGTVVGVGFSRLSPVSEHQA
ncbi:MAG: serine/threonine-protein kinase [Polyangiaceae bacterium]